MSDYHLFTSESVSEGHPDKLADQISDAVLDLLLEQDPDCRCAAETLVKTGLVMVAGEIRSNGKLDQQLEQKVRETICNIGYDNDAVGFNGHSCIFQNALGQQSADIAMGVDADDDSDLGAGDQGMMFGYASDETAELMPTPILLAHKLVAQQARLRKNGKLPWLRPDAKSQVTVRYENSAVVGLNAVVLSTQHSEEIDQETLREAVMEEILRPVIGTELLSTTDKIFINPTGRFIIGGPVGDCGLTGRKIIVDTYGGMARHGGGAFSGKDPTKVDRSAAYAARYVAKNVVAAGLARRCEIQLSYAIGVSEPVSVAVNSFGTGDDERISSLVSNREFFDLSPRGIIEMLKLKRPIYLPTASYGHFGREEESFSWEQTDRSAALRDAAGK